MSRGWRAAVRVARRDAWRAKGRTALVVALIGLPVLVLSGADVLWRTQQLGPAEVAARHLGRADVAVRFLGGHVQQRPDAWLSPAIVSDGSPAGETPSVTTALSGVRRVVAERPLGSWHLRAPGGLAVTDVEAFAVDDPLVRGIERVVAGRAARVPGEVALTEASARAAGVGVGGTVHVADDGSGWRVVGLLRDADSPDRQLAVVAPSAAAAARQAPAGTAVPPTPTTWYARLDAPVTWRDVRRLDATGWAALSRAVLLNPPPDSALPVEVQVESVRSLQLLAVTVIAGMALIEVALLAGPAFAVAARRRERDLALIACVGADRGQLRRMVLADGLVAGLVAGIGGAVLGVAAAALTLPLLRGHLSQYPGPFDVRPLEIAALAGVGLVTAVLAAALPARRAGRLDVVAALSKRSAPGRPWRVLPLIGATAAGLGALLAITAAATNAGAYRILAGVVLVEAGAVMATPMLLVMLARTAARWPLAVRMALRDAGRNRAGVVAAVAAVMAAVVGAVALAVGLTSVVADQRQNYAASLPAAGAWVSPGFVSDSVLPPADAQPLVAALTAAVPRADAIRVRSLTSCNAGCPLDGRHLLVQGRPPTLAHPSQLPFLVVDTGPLVRGLLDTADPVAARAASVALASGRAVVFTQRPRGSADPRLTVRLGHPARVLHPPATFVRTDQPVPQLAVPPALAARLGPAHDAGVWVATTAPPSAAELQALDAAAFDVDHRLTVSTDPGFTDRYSTARNVFVGACAAIAVLAAVIATALAGAERRKDVATLDAVGAPPRVRWVTAAAQGAVVGGVGTALGTLAGFVAPVAYVVAVNRERVGVTTATMPLAVPWAELVALVLAVPLVAAAIGALLGRRRAVRLA